MKPLSKPVRAIPGTKKPTKAVTPRLDIEENEAYKFIRVWQAAKSCEEVAQQMGWTKARASSLAARLRKAEVPLKRFKSRITLDLDSLRKYAAECPVTEPDPFVPSE